MKAAAKHKNPKFICLDIINVAICFGLLDKNKLKFVSLRIGLNQCLSIKNNNSHHKKCKFRKRT